MKSFKNIIFYFNVIKIIIISPTCRVGHQIADQSSQGWTGRSTGQDGGTSVNLESTKPTCET